MTGLVRRSRIHLVATIAAVLLFRAEFLPRAAAVASPAASSGAYAQTASAALRASAVKVDITPDGPQWLGGYAPRQSTGVLDRIHHRVLALEAGASALYLVSSDLCLFSPGLYDSVTAELERETGITRGQVLWSVTHTHAAPEIGPPDMYKALLGRSEHDWDRGYTTRTTRALIEAVKKARDTLEPAQIAFGSGVAMANINRRAKDVDGRVSIGLNPDGPVDRTFFLIRVTRPDGAPLALVVNYAMHGTVMSGQNLNVSGDAPGVVTSYLEERVGGTVLYVNGAAGNIAPIYSVYPDAKSGHLSEFRVLLGNRVLAALENMGAGAREVTLRHAEKVVETPRKTSVPWPDELPGYAARDGGAIRLPLRFVRINDAVIWSAPVEMFCEIAMDVRERSQFGYTMFFGYTNGWFGYLPTARGFEEGGYEPRTSPFTPQAEADVLAAAVAAIHDLRR